MFLLKWPECELFQVFLVYAWITRKDIERILHFSNSASSAWKSATSKTATEDTQQCESSSSKSQPSFPSATASYQPLDACNLQANWSAASDYPPPPANFLDDFSAYRNPTPVYAGPNTPSGIYQPAGDLSSLPIWKPPVSPPSHPALFFENYSEGCHNEEYTSIPITYNHQTQMPQLALPLSQQQTPQVVLHWTD